MDWEKDEENTEDAALIKKDAEKAVELSAVKIVIKYSRNLWTAILHANFLVNYVVFDPVSFCAPSLSSLHQWKRPPDLETLNRSDLTGFLATKSDEGEVVLQNITTCTCEQTWQDGISEGGLSRKKPGLQPRACDSKSVIRVT